MTNKVLIVGTENDESLEGSYRRAFARLGWHVSTWDPQRALTRAARFGRAGSVISRYVFIEPWLRKANLELIDIVKKTAPLLVLVIGTSDLMAGTLGQIRASAPQTRLYSIFPDSPHNLDTLRIAALPLFDRVFTSSPAWVSVFKRLGCSNADYLPFAADTLLYRQQEVSEPISRIEVGFVGNWRTDREAVLNQLCDFELEIWGSEYWGTRTQPNSAVRKKWKGRRLAATQLPSMCARASIMLNVIDGHTWPGPNMRCFELPACGAFALVSRTQAVAELFEEGKTVECFDTIEEARSKIEFYLANEESRHEIAAAAYRFVTEQGHTYLDRVRTIANLIEQDNAGA